MSAGPGMGLGPAPTLTDGTLYLYESLNHSPRNYRRVTRIVAAAIDTLKGRHPIGSASRVSFNV